MTYRRRNLDRKLDQLTRDWGAVLVTGPREAGKTSTLTELIGRFEGSGERTVAFDTPSEQDSFRRDPQLFFANRGLPLFLDEVQHVPDVFPYLKGALDKKPGTFQFFLAGSQQFHQMRGVTESLAGRIAVLDIWPFAVQELRGGDAGETIARLEHPERLAELMGAEYPSSDHDDVVPSMLRGGYPPVALGKPATDWFESYRRTFVQRDIRDLSQVADLGRFDRFVGLCAGRSGTILNKSELSRNVGIDNKTVDHWLSLLETSYQLITLPAYHLHTDKRLVKRPKALFADIGFALHLQAIRDADTLLNAPHFGSLFSSFVTMEIRKLYGHACLPWDGHHWCTPAGSGVDLVLPVGGRLVPIEIHHTASVAPQHFRGLKAFRKLFGELAPTGVLVTMAPRLEAVGDGIIHVPLGLLLGGA